jgi:hypothetical protein
MHSSFKMTLIIAGGQAQVMVGAEPSSFRRLPAIEEIIEAAYVLAAYHDQCPPARDTGLA